jgi:hypothetical protein
VLTDEPKKGDKAIVISCDKDALEIQKFKDLGVTVFNNEVVLTSVLTQELNPEKWKIELTI